MTPAWSELDYYTARDLARRAWEASEPQYVIPGLDGLSERGEAWPSSASTVCPRDAEPGRSPADRVVAPLAEPIHGGLESGEVKRAGREAPVVGPAAASPDSNPTPKTTTGQDAQPGRQSASWPTGGSV